MTYFVEFLKMNFFIKMRKINLFVNIKSLVKKFSAINYDSSPLYFDGIYEITYAYTFVDIHTYTHV